MQLSVARDALAATSLPAKALALFAGGFTDNSGFRSSNVIDIFNGLTGVWSIALLSGRITCAAATSLPALDLAFFTKEGCEPSNWSPKFDVYSSSSVNVSTVHLPEGYGSDIDREFAVTSLYEQNLVFFARQGTPEEEPPSPSPPSTPPPSPPPGPPLPSPPAPRTLLPGVVIYNAKTGNFSMTNRSRPGPRFRLSATSLPAQGLALFFSSDKYYGSTYTVVDIYNASSGKWTNMSLSTMRQSASLASLPDQGLVLIGPGQDSGEEGQFSLVHVFDCSGCPVSQPENPATPATPAKSQLRYLFYFCLMYPLNAVDGIHAVSAQSRPPPFSCSVHFSCSCSCLFF
jgi:hypothetical protein